MRTTIVIQFVAVRLWAILGTVLGVVGVLVSSFLPVVVLGWIFGGTGALQHAILLAFGERLKVLVFGSIVTTVSGVLTFFWAPPPIWPFAISCYFLFSVIIYFWLNQLLEEKFGTNQSLLDSE